MGWKSTIDISRQDAKNAILSRLTDFEFLDNEELAELMEKLGFGDNPDLSYFGYNFNVINKEDE